MTGKTLAAAAAAAGVSERTARRWQSGALPSTAKAPRTWRTREDPFGDVWETEVVPQLVADTEGRLQALTLFRWLCRLGQRIRTFRTEQGLTQAALGLRLVPPVTRAAIANVENGKQRVLAHTLVQLAQILRAEIHRLLPTFSSPRSAIAQQKVLERELKKKLVVSPAVVKRLSARLLAQS